MDRVVPLMEYVTATMFIAERSDQGVDSSIGRPEMEAGEQLGIPQCPSARSLGCLLSNTQTNTQGGQTLTLISLECMDSREVQKEVD
jgi:hypothetical protein